MPDDPIPPGEKQPDDLATLGAGLRGRTRRPGVAQLFEALEKTAPEQVKLVNNALGMKLVLIPAGTLQMGSDIVDFPERLNETPRHEVTISHPFYMGIHLVTQSQYLQVMSENPSRFQLGVGGGPDHPVERVSWNDAMEFCRKLSDHPDERRAMRSYRLPTEAEWEYACRAGTTSTFTHSLTLSGSQANFNGKFPYGEVPKVRGLLKTTAVGSYPANNFGLYDMHGNLWEWCADWYDESYYRHSPRRDPTGSEEGRMRVVRGGCWRNHGATCRVAYRNALVPHNRDPYTGFRVAIGTGKVK